MHATQTVHQTVQKTPLVPHLDHGATDDQNWALNPPSVALFDVKSAIEQAKKGNALPYNLFVHSFRNDDPQKLLVAYSSLLRYLAPLHDQFYMDTTITPTAEKTKDILFDETDFSNSMKLANNSEYDGSIDINDPVLEPLLHAAFSFDFYSAVTTANLNKDLDELEAKQRAQDHSKVVQLIEKFFILTTTAHAQLVETALDALLKLFSTATSHIENSELPNQNEMVQETETQQNVQDLTQSLVKCVEPLVSKIEEENAKLAESKFQTLIQAENVVTRIFASIMHAHPAVSTMLPKKLMKWFPHHKKDIQTHQRYVYRILELARSIYSPSLNNAIVTVVVEKLSVIDAETSALEDLIKKSPKSLSEHHETILQHYQTKLDSLLCLTIDAFNILVASDKFDFNHFFGVYFKHIVPVEKLRYVPFLAFCVTQRSPSRVAYFVDKIKSSFLDTSNHKSLRISCIRYSCALIARAKALESQYILDFIARLVQWMHSYLSGSMPQIESSEAHFDGDLADENVPCHYEEAFCIDADVHRLFYEAFLGIIWVIIAREDAVFRVMGAEEQFRNMRIAKVVRSSLNPLRIVPKYLAMKFHTVMKRHSVSDFEDVLESNAKIRLASTAKWGGANVLHLNIPFGNLTLMESREKLNDFMDDNEIIIEELLVARQLANENSLHTEYLKKRRFN